MNKNCNAQWCYVTLITNNDCGQIGETTEA